MSNGKAKTLAWGSLVKPSREQLGGTATLHGAALPPRPGPPPRPPTGTIALRTDPNELASHDPLHAEPGPLPISGAEPTPVVPRADSMEIGHHDTVQAESAASPRSLSVTLAEATTQGPVSMASAMRTTVLPRLAHVGEVPTLVLDGKARYEESRKLGEGGMGEVLHAHDNDIGRPVAVKRLRADVASPSTLARFVDEIRTVGRLEHPNIIPIHDVGVDGPGEYYFVMKYVDGETVETIIERLAAGDPSYHARYGFEARVQIFRGILEAVAFAHSKGIIHRDIKPANVMVGAYGEVILMDWGIAKQIGTGGGESHGAPPPDSAPLKEGRRGRAFETQIGSLIGTPAYMSPEQARGTSLDATSDVYSLSVLFHELLSLGHYLDGKSTLEEVIAGVSSDDVPHAGSSRSHHQPIVPMDLSWYVRGGTSKDPAKRYPSVQAMLDRLDRRARGEIPVECPVTLVKSMNGRWSRFIDRHPFVVMTVLASMLLGMVVGAISFGMRGHG